MVLSVVLLPALGAVASIQYAPTEENLRVLAETDKNPAAPRRNQGSRAETASRIASQIESRHRRAVHQDAATEKRVRRSRNKEYVQPKSYCYHDLQE